METGLSFGLWVQKRRKALDLTRDELAAKIGSSTSALRKIEGGRTQAVQAARGTAGPSPAHSRGRKGVVCTNCTGRVFG